MITKRSQGHQPGVPNPNAGRNLTSLRPLADTILAEIAKLAAMFSDPVDCTVQGLEIERCACGAVGWSDFDIVAQRHEALSAPDAQGNLYPILGRVGVKGRQAQHAKRCSDNAR